MPEGDTIFRAARALNKALAGRQATGFRSAYAKLAALDDQTPVTGRTVERVEARGKWCLLYFSGDLILLTHMLMSGSWHIYRAGEKWRVPRDAVRVVLETDAFTAVAVNVPVAEFHTAASLARHRMVPGLGPDLLGDDFDSDEAIRRIQAEGQREIADVLLDQRVLAGIGNVYKSEVCFATGVNPFRLASTLTAAELSDVAARSREFLLANVNDGSGDGIVTYSGLRRTTRAADPGARLWVYGRRGQPCRRCGTAISMRKQGAGARSTYWCSVCQPYADAEGNAGTVEGWNTPIRRTKTGCS